MSKGTKSAKKTEKKPKGTILCRVIIEVLGAPKEHIEKAISMLVDRIYDEKDVEVVSEETFEAKERGKLFSTFSEMDIWFKDLVTLEKFIFDYTPSSIEITQPEELTVKSGLLSGIINDFMLKALETALQFKDLSASSTVLAKNTDAVIRNFLLHVLKESMSAEDASKIMGIPVKNLGAILEKFSKVGIVKKEGDVWSLSDKYKNGRTKTGD